MLDREAGRIGRFAWVMAWVGLVVGQLHALSRFATADGQEDLELPLTAAWAEPTADVLAPLLNWADPDVVYVTYGKIWLPVFLAFTLCAFVVYRRRAPHGFERWAWRAALAAYVLACVGVFLDYWTQWTGNYNGDGIEAWFFGIGLAGDAARSAAHAAHLDRPGDHAPGEAVPPTPAGRAAGSRHPAGVRDPPGHLAGECCAPGHVRLRDPGSSCGSDGGAVDSCCASVGERVTTRSDVVPQRADGRDH